MLILSIRNLEEDTIAKMVHREQRENNWPGLAAETAKICEELCIQDCNITSMNKNDCKHIWLEVCHKKNKDKLQLLAKGKCERIKWKEYGKKDYI